MKPRLTVLFRLERAPGSRQCCKQCKQFWRAPGVACGGRQPRSVGAPDAQDVRPRSEAVRVERIAVDFDEDTNAWFIAPAFDRDVYDGREGDIRLELSATGHPDADDGAACGTYLARGNASSEPDRRGGHPERDGVRSEPETRTVFKG